MEGQMICNSVMHCFYTLLKCFLVFAVGIIVFCDLDHIKEDIVLVLLMNNFGSVKALKDAFSSNLLQECFSFFFSFLSLFFFDALNYRDMFIYTIQLVCIVPVFL